MAHDFMIRVVNEEYKYIPDDEAFFYGFAEGIFYEAFHCEHHAMLFSGDGENIVINYQTALDGLKTAIQRFNEIDYPDPSRIFEIKEFYKRMETYYKDQWFEICFS